MCWIQPQVIINLVRHQASNTLTSLSLEGYEELNDLVLEFICGVDADTRDGSVDIVEDKKSCDQQDEKDVKKGTQNGLKHLTSLCLPTKSFVTPYGLNILLQHLPLIETIKNAGRMGNYRDSNIITNVMLHYKGCIL